MFVQDDLVTDTEKCKIAHKEISIKTVQQCIQHQFNSISIFLSSVLGPNLEKIHVYINILGQKA